MSFTYSYESEDYPSPSCESLYRPDSNEYLNPSSASICVSIISIEFLHFIRFFLNLYLCYSSLPGLYEIINNYTQYLIYKYNGKTLSPSYNIFNSPLVWLRFLLFFFTSLFSSIGCIDMPLRIINGIIDGDNYCQNSFYPWGIRCRNSIRLFSVVFSLCPGMFAIAIFPFILFRILLVSRKHLNKNSGWEIFFSKFYTILTFIIWIILFTLGLSGTLVNKWEDDVIILKFAYSLYSIYVFSMACFSAIVGVSISNSANKIVGVTTDNYNNNGNNNNHHHNNNDNTHSNHSKDKEKDKEEQKEKDAHDKQMVLYYSSNPVSPHSSHSASPSDPKEKENQNQQLTIKNNKFFPKNSDYLNPNPNSNSLFVSTDESKNSSHLQVNPHTANGGDRPSSPSPYPSPLPSPHPLSSPRPHPTSSSSSSSHSTNKIETQKILTRLRRVAIILGIVRGCVGISILFVTIYGYLSEYIENAFCIIVSLALIQLMVFVKKEKNGNNHKNYNNKNKLNESSNDNEQDKMMRDRAKSTETNINYNTKNRKYTHSNMNENTINTNTNTNTNTNINTNLNINININIHSSNVVNEIPSDKELKMKESYEEGNLNFNMENINNHNNINNNINNNTQNDNDENLNEMNKINPNPLFSNLKIQIGETKSFESQN